MLTFQPQAFLKTIKLHNLSQIIYSFPTRKTCVRNVNIEHIKRMLMYILYSLLDRLNWTLFIISQNLLYFFI